MSTGFTIDDVRDTLTNDVTRLLGRIETSARDVLERKDLGGEAIALALPLFQAVGDHGHAIYGTARLVSARSLSDSAARIETLAQRGQDELGKAHRHLVAAREIAAALVGGATDMLAMLSLELDARPGEAQSIADSWRLRVEGVVRALVAGSEGGEPANGNVSVASEAADGPGPAVSPAAEGGRRAGAEHAVDSGWGDFDEEAGGPAAASGGAHRGTAVDARLRAAEEFSFAASEVESVADAEAAVSVVEAAAIDVELEEIFTAEARATLAALDEKLAALKTTPDDRGLLKAAERGFHTLKGAAATVGLILVSERASELQLRAEVLVDAGRALSAEAIADLTRDTDALRRLAGVPARELAAPAEPAAPQALVVATGELDEVMAEFEREAHVALDEAEHLLGTVQDSEPDGVVEIARALRFVMHRLKGSALVTGHAPIAQAAAQVELLAEAIPLDVARLGRELAACGALLAAPPVVVPRSNTASFAEARGVFMVELRELLDEAAGLLPGLRAGDPSARGRLARLFHRLKGSALVAADGALSVQAEALHDALMRAPAAGRETGETLAERIIALTDQVGRGDSAQGAHRVPVPSIDAELDPAFQQECADLLEALDRTALALERSERPAQELDDLLRNYHTLKGVVNALGLRPLGEQLHKLEDLLERLRGSAILPPLGLIVGLLLPCHGELRRQLRMLRHAYVEVVPGKLEGRIARLLSRAAASTAAGQVPSQSRPQLAPSADASEASFAGRAEQPDRRNIRVSVDRLEALMNLAGELVINRSRLLSRIDWLRGLQVDLGRSNRRILEVVDKFRDEHEFSTLAGGGGGGGGGKDRVVRWTGFSELELDRYEDVNILARSLTEGSTDMQELFGQLAGGLGSLADDSDTLGTIVAGIQSEVTRARMVPLDVVFSRLQLPVRDAAQREAREVRIETTGASVHLDKTIVDALFQPMLHLVRNAVSHGIERPSARLAAGKPAHGTVSLSARQDLGQVVLEIADDGAGLDLERLRERGAAMGLVAHDIPLDDPRVRELVFVHGLTTHATAGAVAGRGLGCDVVRRAVERLNGSIRVESVRHQRTSFVITLPLTLAITRALLVRQGGDTFAVPLYFTERIVDAQELDIVESANQRRIDVDGTFVPVHALGDFLSGATAPTGPILLLQVGDQRLVVQVDEVLTQEEIVVKSLGTLLRGHPMFAGVTIRGTGEVVLILDVPSMAEGIQGRHAAIARQRPAPAVASPAATAPPAPRPVVEATPATDIDRPMRVLFVDDSVSVRKVAERALRLLGVEVTLAVDGVDALDKLRAGQFDLVFTDLEMPRMHGYELIRELRFLPAYHALPVVVVTSRSGKKHRDEAHALGASEYLTKPFTPRTLAAALIKLGGERARGLRLDDPAGGEATS